MGIHCEIQEAGIEGFPGAPTPLYQITTKTSVNLQYKLIILLHTANSLLEVTHAYFDFVDIVISGSQGQPSWHKVGWHSRFPTNRFSQKQTRKKPTTAISMNNDIHITQVQFQSDQLQHPSPLQFMTRSVSASVSEHITTLVHRIT